MSFSDRYLIKRPLLQALEPTTEGPPVLLIDEIDRADEAFGGVSSSKSSPDFQVTHPGARHDQKPSVRRLW